MRSIHIAVIDRCNVKCDAALTIGDRHCGGHSRFGRVAAGEGDHQVARSGTCSSDRGSGCRSAISLYNLFIRNRECEQTTTAEWPDCKPTEAQITGACVGCHGDRNLTRRIRNDRFCKRRKGPSTIALLTVDVQVACRQRLIEHGRSASASDCDSLVVDIAGVIFETKDINFVISAGREVAEGRGDRI